MAYEIKYDRIPDALSSDLLRCSFCGILKGSLTKPANAVDDLVEGMSRCCTFLTVVLRGDFDLSKDDSVESAKELHDWYVEHLKATPCPTRKQGEYLLDVTEKIAARAIECRVKKSKERR